MAEPNTYLSEDVEAMKLTSKRLLCHVTSCCFSSQ